MSQELMSLLLEQQKTIQSLNLTIQTLLQERKLVQVSNSPLLTVDTEPEDEGEDIGFIEINLEELMTTPDVDMGNDD